MKLPGEASMRPRHRAAEYFLWAGKFYIVITASMRPRHRAAEYKWRFLNGSDGPFTLQ